MSPRLKPLREQVLVITGASSGIGLATARLAARQGARLVLAARSANALGDLARELEASGGEALAVPADVSRPDDVRHLGERALARFGRFDTWINNAGVGAYGRLAEMPLEDMRRIIDTNFFGVVAGSLEAARHLRHQGGAIINVGSTVSDRAAPLQGIYSASKHAVKGFTDALRMELEAEGAPISVTLVKPGPIDTPFTRNAKNYMATAPQHVPTVYAPEAVADAILHCAETPVRDVFVGASGKVQAAMGLWAPRLTDRVMEAAAIPGFQSDKPAGPRGDNALDRPSERLAERGDYPGHVSRSSLYTWASLNPAITGTALVGAGWALWKVLGGSRRRGLR